MEGVTRDPTVTSDTTTITLPFPPDALIVIALVFMILFGSYIIFSILPRDPDHHVKSPLRRVAEGLGFRVDTADQAAVLFTAMLGYLLLFAFAMVIAVRMLGGMAIGPLTGGEASHDQGTSLGFGALLAAILGAPFIIWRSWIAAKQAAIAEEALFNDKINAAATDLAARHEVTRVVGRGKEQRVLTEWRDDLVTRAAAIDRLEGLAKESIREGNFEPAQRIARMLSIYVQELSREHPAQDRTVRTSEEQIRDWGDTLHTFKRPDMERAVQSLGRINPKDHAKRVAIGPKNIDLSRCNLQGFALSNLNLSGVCFDHARMEGTAIDHCSFDTASFRRAKFDGAHLNVAGFRGCNLFASSFHAAWMQDIDMSASQLVRADLRAVYRRNVCFEGADLSNVILTHETLELSKRYNGAAFRSLSEASLDG